MTALGATRRWRSGPQDPSFLEELPRLWKVKATGWHHVPEGKLSSLGRNGCSQGRRFPHPQLGCPVAWPGLALPGVQELGKAILPLLSCVLH